MMLFKAERKVIKAIVDFKEKEGRYPTSGEVAKSSGKSTSNTSFYLKKLSKYIDSKKQYKGEVSIKKEYRAFFKLPEKEQEKIIDKAIRNL